jgi:hypothetical protein
VRESFPAAVKDLEQRISDTDSEPDTPAGTLKDFGKSQQCLSAPPDKLEAVSVGSEKVSGR